MEHAVEIGPVKPRKIDRLALEIGEEGVEILPLGARGIAHMVGDTAVLEMIDNIRADVQAAGLQRVFFLRKIEQRDVFEGDVVEIEVAAEFQVDLEQLG